MIGGAICMKKKIMIVIVAVVLILGAGIIYWRVDQDVPAGMKARIDFIDERRDDIRVYQSSYSDIDGREEITSWFFDKYDWDFKLKNYRTIKDLLFSGEYRFEFTGNAKSDYEKMMAEMGY